jgi:hypothetical protein
MRKGSAEYVFGPLRKGSLTTCSKSILLRQTTRVQWYYGEEMAGKAKARYETLTFADVHS